MTSQILREYAQKLTEAEMVDGIGYVIVGGVDLTIRIPNSFREYNPEAPEYYETQIEEDRFLAKTQANRRWTSDLAMAKWFKTPQAAKKEADELNKRWSKLVTDEKYKNVPLFVPKKAFVMLDDI